MSRASVKENIVNTNVYITTHRSNAVEPPVICAVARHYLLNPSAANRAVTHIVDRTLAAQECSGVLVDKEKTGSVRVGGNAPTAAPPVTLVFGPNPAYKYGQV